MQQPEHVCRVSFIPQDQLGKNQRHSRVKNIESQFIFGSEFTIGSSKDANIGYKSKGVHPLHCKIKIKGKQIFVTDLFSSQGVFVNGKKITVGTPFPIRSGEVIRLGSAQDVITVELFRKPGDPKEESTQILHDAETTAIKMMKEADQIFKEAGEVEEKSASIIAEAEAKANEIILEKKREMQQQYEEKIREAIEEGHKQANEIVAKAEQEVESLRVEIENRSYEVGKKRDRQSKALVKEAELKAKEIIQSGKNEVESLLAEAQGKADSIAATGETRKQEALLLKTEVLKEIEGMKQQIEDLKNNIVEITEENKELTNKNSKLLVDTKKFTEEYEKADGEFQDYMAKLTDEKDSLAKDLSSIQEDLTKAKEDLRHAMSKNEAISKDTKATEIKKRDLVANIQELDQELLDVKGEIQKAFRQKEQAIQEVENQRKKTTQDIAKAKKEFEDEYQRRKEAIEHRFAEIRQRERMAAQERRDLLKKHEIQRLPHQVKNIASSIWNELSVELQDQTVKAEFFSADNSIPKTIEKIVERSVQEEHDLRTKLASQVALYKDVDPKTQFYKRFVAGAIPTAAGALFMLLLVYLVAPIPQPAKTQVATLEPVKQKQRAVSSTPTLQEIPLIENQQQGWQGSYAANINSNPNFAKFVKNQKTDKKQKKMLRSFMMKQLKMDKDQVVQFALKESELFYELKRTKKEHRKANDKARRKAMDEVENRFRPQLIMLLGSEENYSLYLEFQRRQFNQKYN